MHNLARRWNHVAEKFQPITCSTEIARWRLVRLPDRDTTWWSASAWPSARARSAASAAATARKSSVSSHHLDPPLATTAGGSQAVPVLDVPEDEAVRVAATALPDLLTQFRLDAQT